MSTHQERFDAWTKTFNWSTIKWNARYVRFNISAFISQFPPPQERSPKDWEDIEHICRQLQKANDRAEQTQYAEQYLEHLVHNFCFDPDERFF